MFEILIKFQIAKISGSPSYLFQVIIVKLFIVDSEAKTPAKEEVVTMAARLSLTSKVSPLLYQLKNLF